MTVLILAAGYAVRLEPLTINKSKSLLPIGRKKIIERILDKVDKVKSASSIYIVTNAKFFETFQEWLELYSYDKKLFLINDLTHTNETRLGAIRDMEFAIAEKSIDDDLLVIAGDNLFEFDLNRFLEFAKSHKNGVSVALHDIGSIESAKNFGVVKIDGSSKIVDFEEKPENPKSTLISTGIYYFPKNKLSFIDEYVKMQNKLDAPGNYISWLSRKDEVYGFKFTEDWYDIGSLESYRAADKKYSKKGE